MRFFQLAYVVAIVVACTEPSSMGQTIDGGAVDANEDVSCACDGEFLMLDEDGACRGIRSLEIEASAGAQAIAATSYGDGRIAVWHEDGQTTIVDTTARTTRSGPTVPFQQGATMQAVGTDGLAYLGLDPGAIYLPSEGVQIYLPSEEVDGDWVLATASRVLCHQAASRLPNGDVVVVGCGYAWTIAPFGGNDGVGTHDISGVSLQPEQRERSEVVVFDDLRFVIAGDSPWLVIERLAVDTPWTITKSIWVPPDVISPVAIDDKVWTPVGTVNLAVGSWTPHDPFYGARSLASVCAQVGDCFVGARGYYSGANEWWIHRSAEWMLLAGPSPYLQPTFVMPQNDGLVTLVLGTGLFPDIGFEVFGYRQNWCLENGP